ncbi:NAD-dependent epimerase/dehydratase family protein [Hoeflea sp.]|uniref:NAD-dependent epimerase/dehydratase family protein n=1 Tax=Hoeflea sp. TaxID=1940281 RepID=UPI003B52E61C
MTALPDTVIVFGASGFVGRNLVDALAGRVPTLIGVTSSTTDVPGCTQVVALDQIDSLPALPEDTVAIHVAAYRYDAGRQALAQSDILKNNSDLNTRIFHFCAERGIRELRMASSMAVYQTDLDVMDDSVPVDLNLPPNPHESFYAWSKRWAETMADLYRHRFGVNCVSFRLSNPYGPYDSVSLAKAHVAPAFVMKALNADPVFEIRGDPMVERDFTFVGDVVNAFVQSLAFTGRNETFNLCSGRSTTLMELAQTVMRVAGVEKEIRSGAPGAFGPAKRVSTSERIRNSMGLEFASLEEGMRTTIDWYRHAYKS